MVAFVTCCLCVFCSFVVVPCLVDCGFDGFLL